MKPNKGDWAVAVMLAVSIGAVLLIFTGVWP